MVTRFGSGMSWVYFGSGEIRFKIWINIGLGVDLTNVVRFRFGSSLCSVRINFGLSPFGLSKGSDRVKFGFGSISGQSCSVGYGFDSVEVWLGVRKIC